MNVGLKKYLENIIGDNITRKMFFGKFESGRTGAVRAGLRLGSEIQFSEKGSLTQSGRTRVNPGGLRVLLEEPKSVQCSEINFN